MPATSSERFYVGLAATLHDPALAIVDPRGEVLFAEAGERALQDKRAFNAPADHMVRAPRLIEEHCGPEAPLVVAVNWSRGLLDRLRLGVVSELPVLRALAGPLAQALTGHRDAMVWPLPGYRALTRAMTASLTQSSFNLDWSRRIGPRCAVRRFDHHLTHAAHACFTSPFDRALCAVVDGFGEWTSTSTYLYEEGRLTPLGGTGPRRSRRRASLGMFYGMLCGLCGFDPLAGEEWKVMGLAPYGEVDRDLYRLLRRLLRVDGLELVAGCSPREYGERLGELRKRQRAPGSDPLAAADLARTGQEVFAEVMCELLRNLHAAGGLDTLVLTGGCALNSSWNGRVLEETPFERLFVPSAPADDGTALGAALLARQQDHHGPPAGERPLSPFLGSRPSAATLENLVRHGDCRLRHLPGRLAGHVAELLAAGRIVGWMRGRAEFGPRALGHRSIFADPRRAEMKERINEIVKHREGFRPFAPAIAHERGPGYFECYQESPYMERTLRFRPGVRERVPAVVHVDGTGRLQSVRRRWTPELHLLLAEFEQRTGVPVLLNTSLNVMGRPIAHSVEDAVALFQTTGLDALVIEDYLIEKRRPETGSAPVRS